MSDAVPSSAQPRGRDRLRFDSIDFECFPNGRCKADVVLVWKDGSRFEGNAEGTNTLQGGLRAGALAALRASEAAANGRVKLQFVGVKAVRAFDAWVTIVAVRARADDRTYQLLGSMADVEDPTPRSAALALLDGTNRVMEMYLREGGSGSPPQRGTAGNGISEPGSGV